MNILSVCAVLSSSKTDSGEDEKRKLKSSSSNRAEFEDEISRQARNDKIDSGSSSE